ncbi:MAG: efflux RND transporter periplasmic adaptor subunit [Planctomycetes bacterium]|nr:efflux RND transporter periplasmic adaptor subunit [Planctomycetota bacterium]
MPRFSLSRLRRPLLVALGILAMVLLLVWLMGGFHARIPPGAPAPETRQAPDGPRFTAELEDHVRTETAIGTIRAVRETVVASRILGRVKTLAITRAGQPVQQDELLVELEATDLQALLDQARAQFDAAGSRRDQARSDLERTESLARQNIAAPAKVDSDRNAYAAAMAEVDRAEKAVAGAETALGFARITAPIAGIVVDKQINQGDVVQPGQPICTIYDPTRLQLVAIVREELAGRLEIGQAVDVTLDALGERCQGTVAEIVPMAQAQSRSFEVKVTGPCRPGIVTGMFGRLHVPIGTAAELRVPRTAVLGIGQLDFVDVVTAAGTLQRRFVRTGRSDGDSIEILSGLAAGEVVLQNATAR